MFFAHCLDSMRHYDATILFGIAPGTTSMMCRKNTVIRNHQSHLDSSRIELKIYSSNLISKMHDSTAMRDGGWDTLSINNSDAGWVIINQHSPLWLLVLHSGFCRIVRTVQTKRMTDQGPRIRRIEGPCTFHTKKKPPQKNYLDGGFRTRQRWTLLFLFPPLFCELKIRK